MTTAGGAETKAAAVRARAPRAARNLVSYLLHDAHWCSLRRLLSCVQPFLVERIQPETQLLDVNIRPADALASYVTHAT